MKNVFDWLAEETSESFASWALVELMARAGIDKFGEFDSSNLLVEMKINGVHVDFKGLCKEMDSQLLELRERVKSEVESKVKSDLIWDIRDFLDRAEED